VAYSINFFSDRTVQLVTKKKRETKIFSNVNLILSICPLIVYLTIPIK
jgi:hypothetical protein